MEKNKLTFDETFKKISDLINEKCLIELPFVAGGQLAHVYEHLKSFTSDYKFCRKCKKRKPLSFFRYNGSVQLYCKTCVNLVRRPSKWLEITSKDALKLITYVIEEIKKIKIVSKEVLENANYIKQYFEEN